MPYRTQSSDTSRAIEERQIAFFQRLGLNGRLAHGSQIIDEGFESLWAYLKKEFPDFNETQLKVEWIRRHYGNELACRYEEKLKRR